MSWEDEVDTSIETTVAVYNANRQLLCTMTPARWQVLFSAGFAQTAPTAVVLPTTESHPDFDRVLNFTTDCALSVLTEPSITALVAACNNPRLSDIVARRIATLQDNLERKSKIAETRQRSEQLRQAQAYNTKHAPRRGKKRH